MSFVRFAFGLAACASCLSCSAIPDLPNDYQLPVQDILQHTACELRGAFKDLSQKKYESFGAGGWLVAVAVTPKADREATAGVGLTGKSTTDTAANYFTTWALGSSGAPGFQANVKGTRNANVTYNMTSADLLNEKKYPLECKRSHPNYHELARHLGIKEWLVRTVEARDQSVGSLAKLDKPTLTSQIFVKFTGGGNFTYAFPFGTHFGSLSGNFDLDETLSITLSPAAGAPLVVQTLPKGGDFTDGPSRVTTFAVDAQARLDAVQAQQQILDALKSNPR